MQARCHYFWPFLLTGALIGLAGCHPANLIESPMFLPGGDSAGQKAALTQPDTIQQTSEIGNGYGIIHASTRNLQPDGIQQTSATEVSPKKAVTPETILPPVPLDSLKCLTLGQLTGGFDGDNQPGDEALLIELQPRDKADKIVPAFGNVQIIAQQIGPDGTKSMLAVWNIQAENVRKEWRKDSGYLLLLPWSGWPSHEQLHLVARMTVQNGKSFEIDKQVRVHLGARAAPTQLPPGPAPLETASHRDWQPQSLADAIRLLRPVPLRGDE